MQRKKLILTLLIIMIALVAGTSVYAFREDKPEVLSLDTNQDGKIDYTISFNGPSSLTWNLEKDVKQYKLMKESIFTYNLKDKGREAGTITLTLRQIQNKDVIYYINYNHFLPISSLQATITAVNDVARAGRNGSPKITARQILYGKEITNLTSFWETFEISKARGESLPINALFLDSPTHFMRLGLVDVFKPLKNKVRQEHIEKSIPVTVSRLDTDIRYNISFPTETGFFVENWGILGSSPLVNWNNPAAVNDARVGDLVRFRKLSADGIYYLTPWNYYPTEKTAFWLNPASTYHVAGMFSKQNDGKYFGDIAVASMYSAIETQGKDHYWVSTPRSDWLYQDYGIPSGFYDTRFNTDVSVYLLDMYEKTGESLALETAANYATWLREYVSEQGISTSGGGMLVPDYFKKGFTHKKTNVSLNHMVAEMSFLYRLYLINNDFENLKVGNLIKQAIRDTGRSWIREDGNLHYAYLGEGKFGMQDYPLLTLNDLRAGQKLIKLTSPDKKVDDVFQMLINAKESFLRKHNMPIK